jgi:very-short-patch-repair endonuclease
MAPVLASGANTVLSHRGAAALWELRRSFCHEVTVPTSRHPRGGILMHEAELPPDEVTTVEGIPVTTVPRTLLDLAAVVSQRELARAVNEAEIRQLEDQLSLADLVERHPHRAGIAAVRAVLETLRAGTTVTRSELEARFREFVRANGLPPPALNAPVLGLECDCLWRAERLVVELDGRAVHGTTLAFERDRERDRMLQAAGWRVIRVTWNQLHQDAALVAMDLKRILGKKKA